MSPTIGDDGRIALDGQDLEDIDRTARKVFKNPFGVPCRTEIHVFKFGPGWEPAEGVVTIGNPARIVCDSLPEDRAAVLEAAQAVDAAKREEEARQFTDPAFNPLIKTTPE